jgi:cation transport ATPase
MENNCQNCGTLITENFCSNCGQKKYKRIDRKYLIDELQYTVLHTNKGFFYTVKNLFKNPGRTAREFIDGNRVNHYKPILLAFVLTGIITFLAFKVIGMNNFDFQKYGVNKDPETQKATEFILNEFMSFYAKYYTILMMLAIPFFALATKISFKSWKHNYYEHIVLNCFFYSAFSIYSIIFMYPLLYFARESSILFILISQVSFLALPFLLTWFFKEVYNTKLIGEVIVRILGLGAIMVVSIIILCIGGGFLFGYYLAQTGQLDKFIPH